ncbi:MAG: hypothetical protein QGH42_02370 [Kiritimatiellia bacterium]|jgi:hypothetical protein|nr:hypothetical protein [Kiritimatiellia bacterium]MDP6811064.1 hypothetical protein [Kiritimatiellia bacterium]MDP7023081.1 hypothetical protein [Kiritimatiellia bacterium]
MRVSFVPLIALCFITLSGSCRVKAAEQAAAKPVPAEKKEKEAEKPKPDPRFKDVPLHHHDYLKELEKQQPRLMASWFKLRALYDELDHSATVFGTRERKRARSKIPSLKKKIASEKKKFYGTYDRFRKPIEDKEVKLKDRAITLSERKGAQENPAIRKQIDELYDEAYVFTKQIEAIRSLDKVFAHSARLPTDLDLIGISSRDSTTREIAEENPKLIEARLDIKDYEADLARLAELKVALEKDPRKRWGASQESLVRQSNLKLEKAAVVLQREAEKAKKPYLSEAEKLKKKVESTEKQIAEYEKRKRNTTTYSKRLSVYQGEMDRNLEAAALIDKLATWKPPEKQKAPAKKGAEKPAAEKDEPKKGGH